MENEQEKTLKALQTAIQMEIDGKEYYLKASRESSYELGKKLMRSLAAEEDSHRQRFEEIYQVIRQKMAWPRTGFKPDGGKSLRTVFARATEETGTGAKPTDTELDTVKKAMDLENQTYDFYTSQGREAKYDAEREFYESLAIEEREHHLILLDYYEYIKDPAGWFTLKEHPSLDGG